MVTVYFLVEMQLERTYIFVGTKSDYCRERVVDWQEAYMERLVKEYMDTIKNVHFATVDLKKKSNII